MQVVIDVYECSNEYISLPKHLSWLVDYSTTQCVLVFTCPWWVMHQSFIAWRTSSDWWIIISGPYIRTGIWCMRLGSSTQVMYVRTSAIMLSCLSVMIHAISIMWSLVTSRPAMRFCEYVSLHKIICVHNWHTCVPVILGSVEWNDKHPSPNTLQVWQDGGKMSHINGAVF